MNPRTLSKHLWSIAGKYPVLFLTGPRQSGKTTLARRTFPEWPYCTLEDLDLRGRAAEDPRAFLAAFGEVPGLILDEVQRVPELFPYLQGYVDARPGVTVLLTGSQNFLVSSSISQSLAGRAAVLELLPFSHAELEGRVARTAGELAPEWSLRQGGGTLEQTLFNGGYPAIHHRGVAAAGWLESYVHTYVERDVRSLANIGNLQTFHRFVRLCAGRAGQLVNAAGLGADCGIDHTTARRWLSVLEASYIIRLLPSHHENFSKRLVKAPKLYFVDTGLLCHLLGLRSAGDIALHPQRGSIFENFVVGELAKVFVHHGERPPLYFWRDHAGNEVDVVLDLGVRRVVVEAKSGTTAGRDGFAAIDKYNRLAGGSGGVLVYGGAANETVGAHRVQTWSGLS